METIPPLSKAKQKAQVEQFARSAGIGTESAFAPAFGSSRQAPTIGFVVGKLTQYFHTNIQFSRPNGGDGPIEFFIDTTFQTPYDPPTTTNIDTSHQRDGAPAPQGECLILAM
ncbi:uncharacterized protein [Euphorbia lathyris]|uniref:uncharacterized protein n=1 Tax=Euphorbia lathyris TaxID=212925 RepID=UPI0033133EBD